MLYNSASGGQVYAGTNSADVFKYDAQADSPTNSPDTLTFSRAQGDKIDLSALPNNIRFAGVEPASGKAFAAWQWNDSTLRIDLTGDSTADMSINMRGTMLNSGDFILSASPTAPPPSNPPPAPSTAQTLSGTAGSDRLTGGSGADTLTGGSGTDTLTGGSGADSFVFGNGSGGPNEPHDVITDFQRGTDKLIIPNGSSFIGHESEANGTYLNYSGDWKNWLFLEGVTNVTAADFNAPGTSLPPPSAPSSNNLPAHNVQVFETFNNGNTGTLSNLWGHIDKSVSGQISIISDAGQWQDGGMMASGSGPQSGWGYGLYEFTLKFNQNEPGGYALLWPGSGQWPGPEIDVVEVLNDGREYSTVHKNNNGSDTYASYFMPNIDSTQPHSYAVNWQEGYLDFYLDGTRYAHVTSDVPKDYAHGGQNERPSFGVQTWWNAAEHNNQSFILTAYDFTYSTIA